MIRRNYDIECKNDIRKVGRYETGEPTRTFIDGAEINDVNFPQILGFWIRGNNEFRPNVLFKLTFNKKN